jgi:hypothetical protein
MAEVFQLQAFCLEDDTVAWAYFHPPSLKSLETITGSRINLFIPDLGDLFKQGGLQRFRGLQRGELPCLWAEASLPVEGGKPEADAHFIFPLSGLTAVQIRHVLEDLADAAQQATGFDDWKSGFEALQKKRSIRPELVPNPAPAPPPILKRPAADPAPAKPPEPPRPPDPDDKGLLVQLGQKFGLPGVIIGAFFLLLDKVFGVDVLSKLDPGLIVILVRIVFAFSALALLLDFANRSNRRYIPVLAFVFAGVMAWWSTTPTGPAADAPFRDVRVIVIGANGIPVSDAHIWSSLGGEIKKTDSGWEIAIPRDPSTKKEEGKIWAEVSAQGLRGESALTLGQGPVEPVTIQLKKAGELAVRGTVYDPAGYSVGNAIVSVSGYGDEARPTEVNGSFVLPAHAEQGQPITLHAEKPPYPPADLKDYIVGSGPATLQFKATGARAERAAPQRPPAAPQPPKTGDEVIDGVVANLAALKRLPRPATDSQTVEALTPLFARPAFYDIRQEDWRYFLYPLAISRKLLEEHVNDFKAHPDSRQKISDAILQMVTLENEVVALFGPTFSLSEYLDKYGKSKQDFIDHLPSLAQNPPTQFFDKAMQQVGVVREDLKAAGLPLSPR